MDTIERYKEFSTEMIDRSTSKRRIATTSYPVFPFRDSDIYIYSKSGHRLDILAFQYYGDQSLWWVIARSNNLGKGSFNIPPGIRLRIPHPVDQIVIDQLVYPELRNQLFY